MKLVATILLCAASIVAIGQDAETKKLEFLLGEWESKEKIVQANLEFTLKGTAKWSLDGKAVVIDESYEVAGQKVANHILIRYVSATKKYRMWWYSSMSAEPIAFTGEFQGDKKFVLHSEIGTTGFAKQPHRITYTLTESGKFDALLEVLYGDKWSTMTEAKYTRIKSS